jgi:hypothetical protein
MINGEESGEQKAFQIKVKGILDQSWSDWFNGMTITFEFENEITTLTGVVDQARLRGILSKAWDLNLTLISLSRIEGNSKDGS